MSGKKMSGKMAFVALAVTALGVLGSAPTVASKDNIDTREERGGSVRPCSLDGVNPAHHHEIFDNPAVAAREFGFIKSRDGTWHVEPNCHR
jgi:hypothetical protein